MKISEDEKWIRAALEEGRRGIGFTAPNPPVGAVIVKNGIAIARGWHHKVGSPHAEKDALSKLKEEEAQGRDSLCHSRTLQYSWADRGLYGSFDFCGCI